jgi:hypothetical protein
MKSITWNPRLKRLLFLLVGSCILMSAAFVNGYPIVYSDTSTYLASGFELESPFDRPITYGLFVRLFSLNGFSLWPVIFAQALLLVYLMDELIQRIAGKFVPFISLGILVILTMSTGLSWTVSQLMPDSFTAVALLTLILLLVQKPEPKKQIHLYAFYFVAIAMHLSHVLMFAMIILVSALIFRKRFREQRKVIVICLTLTAGSVALMGAALSKSRHVFLFGALVEQGIVKEYLDTHCHTSDFALCAYKDSLPIHAYEFIWDAGSPLYKIGGWKASKEELNSIIQGTMTEPRFLGLRVLASLRATMAQLTHFDVGDGNGRFDEASVLGQRIQQYIPSDIRRFSAALQQQEGAFNLSTWNACQRIFIWTSLIFCIALIFRGTHDDVRSISILLLTAVVMNAWVCGSFANVIDRLGCKLMWVIPFALCLMIVKRFFQSDNKSTSPHLIP